MVQLSRRLQTSFLLILALVVFFAAPASARDKAPPDVPFVDGAVGSVTAECGVADLCATITLPDKDTIQVFNDGAGYCQSFGLDIVRMRGNVVLLKNQASTSSKRVQEGHFRCHQFVSTFLTFDEGKAKLGLFLSHDGTLFGEWTSQQSDTTP